MRPVLSWIDKIADDEHSEQGCCVYDLAYKPDGSELLVAADAKVLIYDGVDGTLLQSLKGHKDLVYAVAWSPHGDKFASGSADKSVIIWTEQHEGTLKYSHGEAIQCLAFHPFLSVLLSCSANDYAHWCASEKNVNKQRTGGRITSCAWSKKGDLFAIGMFDGSFLLRPFTSYEQLNYASDNVLRVERPGGEPIWSIEFTFYDDNKNTQRRPSALMKECVVVSGWDHTISYYDYEGNRIKDDIKLDYDPTCMHYFNDNEFLVVGGSNKQVQLYTKMGTHLGVVAQMDTWVWAVKTKADTNTIVVGCVDGTIACYQLMFSTVHGLHRHMYAYRQDMTDVIVQHLTRLQTTRIKCDDLVKKVAIYNNKLAVQLSNRVVIYKQVSGEREGEHLEYRMVDKINNAFECSLLVVTSQHMIICQERNLQCYDQKGVKQREWHLDSLIRYIKVIGGPPGRESILVGMRSGHVCKILVDNPFPVTLLDVSSPIRCLDLSLDRRFIAIVDEKNTAQVFDLKTKEILFAESQSSSIAFNAELEKIICFSGGGTLHIRAENFPIFQQRMQFDGFVVGFSSNKVYCLHMYAMSAIEVPFSTQLYQYVERNNFREAYKVACLGVTEEDWRVLASQALYSLDLSIALKAYSRVKDYKAMQLVQEIRRMIRDNEDKVLIHAKILAYNRKVEQAAQLYKENGYEHEAMQLYTDLRMFDDAQAVMHSTSGDTQKELMRKRAKWAKESNEPKLAANMFISSGDYDKALNLIIQHNWLDLALVVMNKLDRSKKDLLLRLADYLAKVKEYGTASKIYNQLNEMKKLLQMHITANHWTDAFAIADRYQGLSDYAYVEYGRYLGERDQFEEAQEAFHKAGADKEALALLHSLSDNAVTQNRFKDAAYYYWLLCKQFAERAQREDDMKLLEKSLDNGRVAEVYYAYDSLHSLHNQPFVFESYENLLNKCRFVADYDKPLKGVSKAIVYFHMSSMAQHIGAYKLARSALDQLKKLHLPLNMQRLVDVATIKIRAFPISDDPSLHSKCFACGLSIGLEIGHICRHCSLPFTYCFITFDVLPLGEFFVDGITEEETLSLIQSEPPLDRPPFNPFQGLILSRRGERVVVGRSELSAMDGSCVLVSRSIASIPTRFFFNLMPTVSLTVCEGCNHIFHSDDWEMSIVNEKSCPFCRRALDSSVPSLS